MTNQELIDKLQEELNYTQLNDNIGKLFTFLTSEEVNNIDEYHRVLLETQLNAMNIYRNTLILRMQALIQFNNENTTQQDDCESNQQEQ